MARLLYGCTAADYTITSGGRVIPNTELTVWDAIEGGTQITDLTDYDGNAVGTVTSEGTGFVRFYGPDGENDNLWLDSGQNSRVLVRPTVITADIGDGSILDEDIAADADIARTKIAGTALTEATSETVRPEYHGAVGNGTDDDLTAFLAAVATGKSLWLTNGTTYLLSGPIELAAGQNVYGNGATIKRADQVATTTTTAITSGVTTSITVASAAGLKVGQRIAVVQDAVYNTSAVKIASIVGTTVTFETKPTFTGGPLTGTTGVYTCGDVIKAAAGCTVRDVVIDGNKAGTTWAKWTNQVEIETTGDRVLIDNCYLYNCPAEGVGLYAGDYLRCQNTTVSAPDGNGIHLSGATSPVVHACTVLNANGDPTVGHSDGCIIWSNLITDATVSDCYMNGGVAGIGSLDSGEAGNTDSDVTVTGCTIRNMSAYAVDAVCPDPGTADQMARIVFVGNRIYDSVEARFSSNVTASAFIRDIVFADNHVQNTKLTLAYARDMLVSGNTFTCTDADTRTVIESSGSKNLSIVHNTFTNAPGTVADLAGDGVRFSHNMVRDCADATYGVYVGGTAYQVNDNVFTTTGGPAWYSVIRTDDGSGTISGNVIDGAGIAGIGISVTTTARVALVGNRVSLMARHGIYANSSNCTVSGNVVKNCGTVHVAAGIALEADNIAATGNRCYDDRTPKLQCYGIRVNAGDNAVLSGNLVDGNLYDGVKVDGGVTNVNAVPYRKIAATVAATQTTIAHGLSYAPLSVAVTMTSAGTVWKSAASDATNIYLTADDAGRTCDVLVG